MVSDEDLKFEKKYRISVIALHINGTYPTVVRNKLWAIQIILVCFVKMFALAMLGYSILFHDIIKENFTEACKNLTMFVVGLNSIAKVMCLLHYRQSILSLIRNVEDDYKVAKQLTSEEKSIVMRYVDEGRLVCLFWFICTSTGTSLFPVKAIAQMAYSSWIGDNKLVLMFDLTFPEPFESEKENIPGFCLLFAVCMAFGFVVAVMLTGFDPLIPIFTMHACGQLDILGRRLTNNLVKAANSNEKQSILRDVVKKLHELYSLVDRIQNNFRVLSEFNMKTTTILLPIIAFNVVEELRHNKINYEFFILFIGSTIHFMIPCYYSDVLMERSDAFRQSVYNCGWEKYPEKSLRQTVLLMLTRATRPLCISTVFYTISLDTFASMMKQAYSIFNLMNAAWAK